MPPMDSFEQVGTRGFYRPVAEVSFEQAVDMVAGAMRHARTLRVAMVARPEVVDPQKIRVLTMQNRGGNGDVFTHEADAIAWLDSRLAPGERPGFAERLRTGE